MAILAALSAWYILVFQAGTSATMYGMMGQMMGGQYSQLANPMPAYFSSSLILLIVALAAGTIGTVYYVTYPQIKQGKTDFVAETKNPVDAASNKSLPLNSSSNSPESSKEGWSMLLRTSKPDEKRVLEVLSAHNGVYLQKLIVKESGLSKLKTHRIISRFAERGIVEVKKSGNTNEVRASSWLTRPTRTEKNSESTGS